MNTIIIKYKPELADAPKYFKNEDELVLQLRKDDVDKNSELSNQYIIAESYELGEWDYEVLETKIGETIDKLIKLLRSEFSGGQITQLMEELMLMRRVQSDEG